MPSGADTGGLHIAKLIMPSCNETHLERKLRQLGMSKDKPLSGFQRQTFKLYLPRPPYDDVEFNATRTKDGYNFVGQLLGHKGATLQKIQKTTGAKIEIADGGGNLNGAHTVGVDFSLHALVITDSLAKLEKAVRMVAEVLSPVNCDFAPFKVTSNGEAVLTPVRPGMRQYMQAPEEKFVASVPVQSAWNRVPNALSSGEPGEEQASSQLPHQQLIPAPIGTPTLDVFHRSGSQTAGVDLWRCSAGTTGPQQHLSWTPIGFAQCQKEVDRKFNQWHEFHEIDDELWSPTISPDHFVDSLLDLSRQSLAPLPTVSAPPSSLPDSLPQRQTEMDMSVDDLVGLLVPM